MNAKTQNSSFKLESIIMKKKNQFYSKTPNSNSMILESILQQKLQIQLQIRITYNEKKSILLENTKF
jgi:hypothetical protein